MNDNMISETINARNWDLLLDAIEKERVVPIIGNEFFYIEDKSSQSNIRVDDDLIAKLAERFDIQNTDVDFTLISDTIDDENLKNRRTRFIGNQTDIYFEIDNILRNSRIKCQSEIIDFLSINKFPLILTTSYISGLEPELQAIYGDIDVRVYDKSARSDIGNALSTTKPTLFYLFGRANRIKKTFMVTEDDLLDYLHLWHNVETRPLKISDYLKDKFLLVLGCNYPNWLFRFFWHSIRNFTISPNSYEMQGVVALDDIESDNELTKFLSRIQTQVFENGNRFISEFMQRWNSRDTKGGLQPDSSNIDDTDIFISYAKEDVNIVRNIAERLRNLGAEVWLDENKLEWSDMYETIIEEKITKAKRFIPIISQTTTKPGRRFYRREWAMAIREMDYRYGMPFFAPIVIDDSDINSTLIPEPFRKAHIISISDKDFEQEMKKLIRSFR
jgi:hypothetical protein